MSKLVVTVVAALAAAAGCRQTPVKAPEIGDAGRSGPAAAGPAPTVTAVFTSPSGRVSRFELEVADTPEARARGLMFRKSLAPDRGMLFVFPHEDVQTFYMKNTYVPLDMVFVNSRGIVVGVVEDARPLTLDTRSVGVPSMYVVELNAFTARKNGIGPGTRVTFDPAPRVPVD